ncbi:MAG: hypothetical protein HYV15_02590, partial [Elusimicrobia bacterium]|nr:hypothetical protein [Elusimicrobiota bacterium]
VAETAILYQFAKQAVGEQNASLLQAPKGHGTRILYYNKGVMNQILDWIDSPVKAPDLSVSTDTLGGLEGSDPSAVPSTGTSSGSDEPDPSLAD